MFESNLSILRDKDDLIQELQIKVQKLKTQTDSFNKRMQRFDSKNKIIIDQLEDEKTEREEDILRLIKENEKLDAQESFLRRKVERMKVEIDEREKEYQDDKAKFKATMVELRKEKEGQADILASAQVAIRSSKMAISELEMRLANQGDDMDGLIVTNRKLETENSRIKVQVQNL